MACSMHSQISQYSFVVQSSILWPLVYIDSNRGFCRCPSKLVAPKTQVYLHMVNLWTKKQLAQPWRFGQAAATAHHLVLLRRPVATGPPPVRPDLQTLFAFLRLQPGSAPAGCWHPRCRASAGSSSEATMIPSSEAAATGSATIVPTPASAIKPTAVTWVESGLLKATTVDDARLAVAPSPSPVGRSTPLSTLVRSAVPHCKGSDS